MNSDANNVRTSAAFRRELRSAESARVRAAAARKIGHEGDEFAVADLIAGLFDQDVEVQIAARDALNQIGAAEVNLEYLNNLFASDHEDERSPLSCDQDSANSNLSIVPFDPSFTELSKAPMLEASSHDVQTRADALARIAREEGRPSLPYITRFFDDQSSFVRNAAALAIDQIDPDRSAEFFEEIIRTSNRERRENIALAVANSGLAMKAIGHLTERNRERVYNALSLLALMAKNGSVEPLVEAVEQNSSLEVRTAAVRLLNLSGAAEVARSAARRRLDLGNFVSRR